MEIVVVGKSHGYEIAEETPGKVWAVSSVFPKFRDPSFIDLIFNLHTPDLWEPWLFNEAHRTMTAFPRKVVPEGQAQFRRFPAKELLDQCGPVFGSTVAWMIAFAITQTPKPERIHILGVDMATEPEYIEQRDTLFYWIGRAEAYGIEVKIPETSRIFFKDRIYGVLNG